MDLMIIDDMYVVDVSLNSSTTITVPDLSIDNHEGRQPSIKSNFSMDP